MKVEGEHRFRSSRNDVWRALQDPQMLADSLPGVRRFEVAGEDRYKVTVTVGLGAVKGSYAGVFALEDKRDLEFCRVVAQASGTPGSISTTAEMRLADLDGGATLLTYDAQASVTGPLAGVGQRMVEAAARKTTREFLETLDQRLSDATAGVAARAAGATSPADAPGAAAELSDIATPGNGTAPTERRLSAPGDVVVPSAWTRPDEGRDLRLFIGGALTGFAMAIVGVLIGRRTPHR